MLTIISEKRRSARPSLLSIAAHRSSFRSDWTTLLFPLKSELARIPFGGVNFYGEGDRITVGTLELQEIGRAHV